MAERRGAADEIFLGACVKILCRARDRSSQRATTGWDLAVRRQETTGNSLLTIHRHVRARLTRLQRERP